MIYNILLVYEYLSNFSHTYFDDKLHDVLYFENRTNFNLFTGKILNSFSLVFFSI